MTEPRDDLPNKGEPLQRFFPDAERSLYQIAPRPAQEPKDEREPDQEQHPEPQPHTTEPKSVGIKTIPACILIIEPCVKRLMTDLTSRPPEHAGALFGPVGCDYLVTHYESFDDGGTPVTFDVDGRRLTEMIRARKPYGLQLQGIVHSHPPCVSSLSSGDIRYVVQILNHPKNDQPFLFMPIVCDDRFIPFIVDNQGHITKPAIFLIAEEISFHDASKLPAHQADGRRLETSRLQNGTLWHGRRDGAVHRSGS